MPANGISYYFVLPALFFFMTEAAIPQQIGYTFDGSQKKVEMPFENLNNLIVIPVQINHLLTLKFILDSGVGNTILTDKILCDFLHVTLDRKVSIPVVGTKQNVDVFISHNADLNLPDIAGKGMNMLVLEEDYLDLRSYLGENVQGILGNQIFNFFAVRIDYTSKLVTFIDNRHFRPPRRYHVIPVSIENNKPFFNTTITMDDGRQYRCKLMIDLGASHSILLGAGKKELLPVPDRCLHVVVGRGLGGDIDGCIGRIDDLGLGGYTLKDITASFADEYPASDTIHDEILQGTLGGDILSRFNIIFDYAGKRIFLKKNYTFRRPFEYNLSGLQVIASGPDLRRFEVVSCIQGSPAAKAGVRPGDILLGVNGSDTKYLTLNQINRTLFSHPGRNLCLKILRNGEIIKVKFKLVRII